MLRKASSNESSNRFKKLLDYAWLNIGDTSELQLVNPMGDWTAEESEDPVRAVLRRMRRPEYFGWTCKVIFNVELLPIQLAILWDLWRHPFPMLIGSRGLGKSFLLALYSMLRAFLCQGVKVVIVGASFRQSKVIFEYCETIWHNAPILRDLCGTQGRSGPRRDIDRCTMTLGDSVILALPLGNGDKIRGQRANYIIADEFNSIPREVFETVVAGFGVVSSSPVEQVKRAARIRTLKEKGLWTAEMESKEAGLGSGNQTILSGTAGYDFQHFSDYHKRWKAIIESRGDRKKLAEIFGSGDAISPKFNWKDYSIIRVPYELLPEGYMDEKTVARSRATVHSGIYQMEFGACHHPETQVITDKGVKSISRITTDDYVLTHRGRFRRVRGITCRNVDNAIFAWKTAGVTTETITTGDHPFWIGGESWKALNDIEEQTRLASLKELNENKFLDLRAIVGDYMETNGRLYPRHSQSKFTREEIAVIRASTKSQSELARQYGVKQGTIHNIIKKPRTPKNSIPATIPLDYSFGLIVGYYAAEGSVAADGRSVGFALDGHVCTRLEQYISELSDACKKVFGFSPKQYSKDKNVTEVVVNSRLVANLLKRICPGVSHTKFIDPEILYSNEQFLRGFITGYWNGDGHRSLNRDSAVATCVNNGLLSQIRVALTYFGIGSSLYPREGSGVCTFRGRQYKCRQAYCLVMNGDNGRRFNEQFYKKEYVAQVSPRQMVSGDEKSITFRLTKKEPVSYDGLVYNLHVEEDESYSLLNATVHNCFSTDSAGFYGRKLIESCVVKHTNPISLPGFSDIYFTALLRGNPNLKYIIGVDPASESDNFSIFVLECYNNHRRIVYGWTTTRSGHREKLSARLTKEENFYSYCARKIRDLMRIFPTERIAMDSQGGGISVEEALHDTDKLEPGELPIWQIKDQEKEKPTDNNAGLHILEMVNFANANWTAEANHGMKKDLEDKVLLFPHFDGLSLELSLEDDKRAGRVKIEGGKEVKLYDTLEDCVMEIEQLKDEMSTIVHTQTANGRDRWDTPEVKLAGNKKGRLRKDRYSAVLIANMAARSIMRAPPAQNYPKPVGGFARQLTAARGSSDGRLYYMGPEWTQSNGAGTFGACVRR